MLKTMNLPKYFTISIVLIFMSLTISVYTNLILFLLFTILVILLSILFVIWMHLKLSCKHITTIGAEHLLREAETFRLECDKLSKINKHSPPLPQIFGRTVDPLLLQLLDFIIRDYIVYHLNDYAYDPENLCATIREDLWGALQILVDRFFRIDHAKMIAYDIVIKITNHLEKIRESKSLIDGNLPLFILSSHVLHSDKELEYIRNVSEILIMFLLPRSYSLSPSKYFLREILTCKIFQPFVNIVTDPDFFNRNVIEYINAQKSTTNVNIKAFESAKSFDDIIKIILKSDDIEVLKSIRYNLVTRLMQATTLQNLNRSKGVDLDNEKVSLASSNVNKSDIIAAKKLKKFIQHLSMAKEECEKRLIELGWEINYHGNDELQKSLSVTRVLNQVIGRKYLSQFLETLASQDLVRYWIAVEELRTANKKNWHQLGAEIFYTFIRNPTSEIKVDKNTRKRMESFLLGDKGPEIFYEIQNNVVQILADKYYHSFLISDYYKEMLMAIEKENDKTERDPSDNFKDRQLSTDYNNSDDNNLNVDTHSNYAKHKLEQLEERLINKTQAFEALKKSLKSESKILIKLEKEVEWLQGERRQLEAHLARTEIWADNLGKWRAIVQSAEVPDEKEPPQFVIVVHVLKSDSIENNDENENISTGWVVCRSLNQFQDLHRKLRPLSSEIRNLELPSSSFKFLFGKLDKSSLEKAKQQIQKYLDFILVDDKLNQSEAVYSFLSPSSDHLKYSTPSPKRSRFSLSTLFKSGNNDQNRENTINDCEEIDDIYLDTCSTSDTVDYIKSNGQQKLDDSIAEPLYALLSEVFDMRGLFKYVRKTLIVFVQVTYGRNINRQIYDVINWWFSEQMLHYYLTLILKNFWPGGTLATFTDERSTKLKLNTAKEAKELFINNVPELITVLVGNNAAKNGAKKIFDALQNKKMNKQLFYDIFEILFENLFPELC